MLHRILNWLFPPKCIFCRKLLTSGETDLCHSCRIQLPEFLKSNFKLSFVARWTAVWYYKDTVRGSILRFKFSNRRSYAQPFGRFLAMKLLREGMDRFDLLTWAPISPLRRVTRGYDQGQLLAQAVGQELQATAVRTLNKVRNTPPQSGFSSAAQRRANVLDAYRVTDPDLIRGKRILLLDDVLTTGATASECARTLLTAGAREVSVAVIAVASHGK